MARTSSAGASVAIFGATSGLAAELRRALEERAFPVGRMSLYDRGEREGRLAEFDGEAMIVTEPDRDTIGRIDLSFLCGEDDPGSVRYVEWIEDAGGRCIDLTGATRQREGVPMVHFDVNPEALAEAVRVVVAPHPMAHPIATLLHALGSSFGVDECCATVIRPVSDMGRKGIEELHQQTISVLNLEAAPIDVFGRQVAFNVVPLSVQGEAGPATERIVREDVIRVLGSDAPPLALSILQAPVFYGHGYLLRARLAGAPDAGDVESALTLPGLVTPATGASERTPAELAEATGLRVAALTADPSVDGGWWIWAVVDAIRAGIASNAARIAGRMAGHGSAPRAGESSR
jgi:aspartate-semialdehyde dehydrogenase